MRNEFHVIESGPEIFFVDPDIFDLPEEPQTTSYGLLWVDRNSREIFMSLRNLQLICLHGPSFGSCRPIVTYPGCCIGRPYDKFFIPENLCLSLARMSSD